MSLGEIYKQYRKAIKAVGTNLNRRVMLTAEGLYNGDEEPNYVRVPFASCRAAIGFSNDRGLNVKTQLSNDLAIFADTFNVMKLGHGWEWTKQGYTHATVEIADFTDEELLKLYYFGHLIEPYIFALVNGHRNKDARKLHKGAKLLFSFVDGQAIRNVNEVTRFLRHCRESNVYNSSSSSDTCRFGVSDSNWLYPWLTMNGRKIVGFDLFHCPRNVNEFLIFGLIAYRIVETVKNSTVEQLRQFGGILDTSANCQEAIQKLCAIIGMPPLPTRSERSLEILSNHLSNKASERTEFARILTDNRRAVLARGQEILRVLREERAEPQTRVIDMFKCSHCNAVHSGERWRQRTIREYERAGHEQSRIDRIPPLNMYTPKAFHYWCPNCNNSRRMNNGQMVFVGQTTVEVPTVLTV